MTRFVTKIGFCPDCRKNVQHVHVWETFPARLADGCTLSMVPRFFRVGSWHCRVCNRQTVLLPFPRRQALNDLRAFDEAAVESAGNYIRREQSLVLRSERHQRYSRKFRQGVVERLLSGQVSLQSLREELNLPEADLITWIAEVVENQAEMIRHLNRMVDVLVENTPQVARLKTEVEFVHKDQEGADVT